jgi:pimeloyl-[acyl-carrier protein] methyl ester esterase
MSNLTNIADNNTLHMDVQGQGDTLVMLHGWGMHSGIWRDLVASLARHFRVVCIDLPGHGHSPALCPLELQAVSQQILSQVPHACHWLGWSLGASIVMNLVTLAPAQIKSMTLLSANPCFIRNEHWPHGIDARVFENFAEELQLDYQKTLKKFIALQTLSSDAAKVSLKQLRDQLFEAGKPDAEALRQGLGILMHADLRSTLQQNDRPCLVVLGERDQLVPASITAFYHQLACVPQIEICKGAGHAPFVSHPQQMADIVTHFCNAHADNTVYG